VLVSKAVGTVAPKYRSDPDQRRCITSVTLTFACIAALNASGNSAMHPPSASISGTNPGL
jgi:hypothetical protein